MKEKKDKNNVDLKYNLEIEREDKKDVAKNIAKMSHKKATSNVEVAKEDMPRYDKDYVEHEQDEERGLLNDITNDEE